MMSDLAANLIDRFDDAVLAVEQDAPILTVWLQSSAVPEAHRFLKYHIDRPFPLLADLWAIDEAGRVHGNGQPRSGVTLASHLVSLERNTDIVLKTPLNAHEPRAVTVVDVFRNADWYEREAFDMFGIIFAGRESHRRILMPPTWEGHPLRKEHYARATEQPPFELDENLFAREEEALADIEPMQLPLERDGEDLMVLNFGPHHPAAHGVFRVVLALDGEEIVAACPDIGYHHRGAEKMGERQTWHGYIPYTDRVDYLGGSMNELGYLMAVERLCGIEIPDRARVVRVMLSEFYRITNHLLFYGTMAHDTGALSPVFYMFVDREIAYRAIEHITGARMHPGWFRIGGLAADLPSDWRHPVHEFLQHMTKRLEDYEGLVMRNDIFRARTVGIASFDTATALDWGVTGPMLRATGCAWDWRKARPYLGFENFDFDVPTADSGDCYARTRVRIEEIRQSLHIIRQCVDGMPEGPIKADHPLTTPPPRDRMLHDIETLIQHFMNVSWGPNVPPGEATGQVESVRGLTQYALISDGGPMSHRTRIRTPSFTHLQMISDIAPGLRVPDFVAFLGSIDFVMSDVDR